jgi:dienelactone hydrolase
VILENANVLMLHRRRHLLTPEEEYDRNNVFDISLLAARLVNAVRWLDGESQVSALPLGLFGVSTGAAAAIVAAARLGGRVGAIVSRGGRADLAGDALDQVLTPTLLIAGGHDYDVIELNKYALARLRGPKALETSREPVISSPSQEHWTR